MRAKNLISFTYKDEPRLILEIESNKPHLRTGVDLYRFLDKEENVWRSFQISKMGLVTETPLDLEVKDFLEVLKRNQLLLEEFEAWEAEGLDGDLDLDTF